MATKTADPTVVITDTFLTGVKQSQELAFSGLTAWADFAGKAFTLPQLEAFPLAESIPSPKEFIEASFGFAEELFATQKEFAIKLVDSLSPAALKKTA